jgi:hypothetical protein
MNTDIIPAIHNYCDRLCERCPFSRRCEVGLAERKRWAKGDIAFDWIKEVHNSMQEALQMLDVMLQEMGVTPEELAQMPMPEPDPDIEKCREAFKVKSRVYYRAVETFFAENGSIFEAKGIEYEQHFDMDLPVDISEIFLLNEACSTIHWFMHFIGVKANRAIHGREDWEEWDDPLQSDSNGSAKVCCLAIERSLSAWEIVRRNFPEKSDEVLDMCLLLRDFQRDMEALFPDWRKFVRPGFDTEKVAFAVFHDN